MQGVVRNVDHQLKQFLSSTTDFNWPLNLSDIDMLIFDMVNQDYNEQLGCHCSGLLETLLQAGADVNSSVRGYGGYKLLHLAAKRDCFDCTKTILNFLPDVNKTDENGDTALHVALKSNSFKAFNIILNHPGVDFTVQNNNEHNVLHTAVFLGHVLPTSELLEKMGKDLSNLRSKNNTSALHIAAKRGHCKVFDVLMFSEFFSVDELDDFGNTPLILAAKKCLVESVRGVLIMKPNVNLQNHEGQTALHLAASNGHYTIFCTLINSGAASDIIDKQGRNPVMLACFGGHTDFVREIFRAYPTLNINLLDNSGESALHHAAFSGNISLIKTLVTECNADINIKTFHNHTPLMLAVEHNNRRAADILLDFNANVNTQNIAGNTALHLLTDHKCLPPQNNEKHCLMRDILNAPSIDFSLQNNEGYTVLHLAAENGCLFLINCLFLIIKASDVKTNMGLTALHLAAANGHVDVVKAFVSSGQADLNAVDSEGRTPLMIAALEVQASVVEYLVENGANVNQVDAEGKSALHHALKGSPGTIHRFSSEAGELSKISRVITGHSPGVLEIFEEMTNQNFLISSPSPSRGIIIDEPNKILDSALALSAFLVKSGADLTLENHDGKSCASIAGRLWTCRLISFIPADPSSPISRAVRMLCSENWEGPHNQLICSICLEQPFDTAFPCGHLACSRCSVCLSHCHVCRAPTSKRIRLFL